MAARTSRTPGRYILLDRGKIVAEGKLPRPNDGKVTDTGIFILNDWGSSESLKGVFVAFRPDGAEIVSRKFEANLYNNGLSADGSRAVCQTANAPNDDGSLLTVFDLSAGKEIGAWRPESGWARSYEFSEDGETLRLVYPERGSFAYSLDGHFIDRMKWLAAGLAIGDILTVETLLRETNNQPPPALAQQLLSALDVARASPTNTWPKVRARILKSRGICFEAIAEVGKALEAYEEALALDPKIGVKRKADQLRKIVP
jgi:tetratricopeptide (TPR) repeat protein